MKIEVNFGRPVEPLIWPLVMSMNVDGVIKTYASCEGHKRLLDGSHTPYVAFECPVGFAALLNRRIQGDLCRPLAKRRLNYPWRLRAAFNAEDELRFDLRVPQLDAYILTYRGCLMWSRRKMNRDFRVLKEFAQATVLEWRQHEKPEIGDAEQNQDGDSRHAHDQQASLPDSGCNWVARLGRFALRAHPGFLVDGCATRPTWDKSCHECSPLGCGK